MTRAGKRLRFGSGASSFNPNFPSTISGLKSWHDSDDASTFTYSSGNVVSQWNDKSGNGFHVTQSTVANQPTRSGTQNGRSTVVYDGVNDGMACAGWTALSQPYTIFAVIKCASTGLTNSQYVSGTGASAACLIHGGKYALYAGAFYDTATTADTSFHSVIHVLNGASSAVYLDGSSIGTGNPGGASIAATTFSLGRIDAVFWNGSTAEVCTWPSVLSAGDITSMSSYSRSKWGTP